MKPFEQADLSEMDASEFAKPGTYFGGDDLDKPVVLEDLEERSFSEGEPASAISETEPSEMDFFENMPEENSGAKS